MVAAQLDWVSLVEGRAVIAAIPLIVRPAVFLVAVLAWPWPLRAGGIAAAFVLGWTLAAASSMLLVRLTSPPVTLADEPEMAISSRTRMLRRGIGYCSVTLLNQLQLSADVIVVGATLGARAAGIYVLASAFAVAASVFANAGGQLALARAGSRDPGEFGRMLAGSVVVGVAASLGLAVAGPWLLRHLVGAEFIPAAAVLAWLAPWLLLTHPTSILQAVLAADGRQAAVLRANIMLSVALCPALALAALTGEPGPSPSREAWRSLPRDMLGRSSAGTAARAPRRKLQPSLSWLARREPVSP